MGNYDLLIDDRKIATYSSDDLTAGINLALLDTPMLEQARLVAYDTEKKNSLEGARFQIIRGSAEGEASPTARALADALAVAENRQRADAQPRPHRFQLLLVAVPPAHP